MSGFSLIDESSIWTTKLYPEHFNGIKNENGKLTLL
jgi:hypothetical protein